MKKKIIKKKMQLVYRLEYKIITLKLRIKIELQ